MNLTADQETFIQRFIEHADLTLAKETREEAAAEAERLNAALFEGIEPGPGFFPAVVRAARFVLRGTEGANAEDEGVALSLALAEREDVKKLAKLSQRLKDRLLESE